MKKAFAFLVLSIVAVGCRLNYSVTNSTVRDSVLLHSAVAVYSGDSEQTAPKDYGKAFSGNSATGVPVQ